MEICWLRESVTIEEALKQLGHSRSSIKKSQLKKQILEKRINERSVLQIPSILFNRGEINPVYQGLKPVIIGEEKSVLAVSKPSRIHCHPLAYNESDNLLSFLRESGHTEYLSVNTDGQDRGLLYRLDYETSGLCLFTKDEETYQSFRTSHHEAKKTYLACVEGDYSGDSKLTNCLSTSGKVIKVDENGKEGSLIIEEVKFNSDSNQSLLKVQLVGGMRHQIRVQLAHAGYPLIGDTLYGGREDKGFGLHCFQYQWRELLFTDDSFSFESF